MSAVIQGQPGRSVRLARLWLVTAVLLGVAWMHGLQCSDGMTMMTEMPAGAMHVAVDSPTDVAAPAITSTGDNPTGLGDVLGACLVLLVGVLGAMLLDRHAARRLIAVVLAAARPPHRARVRLRAPTLAQLCLLRT